MASHPTKIILCDVDGTLFNCDTTKEFIRYYLFQQKAWVKLIHFYFLLTLEEFGLISDLKRHLVFLLKHEALDKTKQISKDFVNLLFKKYLNLNIYYKIKELSDNFKIKIILVSGSIEPLVETIALKINGIGFGSFLGFDNEGLLTGELDDISLKKTEIIEKIETLFGTIDYKNSFAFSNNYEDLNLLKKFGFSYGVILNNKEKKFWELNNIKTIYVNPRLTISPYLLFLPGMYYIYSRKNYKSIRLITVYYLLIPFLSLPFLESRFIFWYDCLVFPLSFLIYFSIYEIGAIYNDLIITNKEKNPTIRIDQSLKNKSKILIFAKLFFSLFLFLLLYLIIPQYTLFKFERYLIFIFLTLLIFTFHNLFYKAPYLKIITLPLLKFSNIVVPLSLFDINLLYPFLYFISINLPKHLLDFYLDKISKVLIKNETWKFYYTCYVLIIVLLFISLYFSYHLNGFLYISLAGLLTYFISLSGIIKKRISIV